MLVKKIILAIKVFHRINVAGGSLLDLGCRFLTLICDLKIEFKLIVMGFLVIFLNLFYLLANFLAPIWLEADLICRSIVLGLNGNEIIEHIFAIMLNLIIILIP